MGWLTIAADPTTGAWGQPHPDDGWLQVVNGFYRLTRGTYAQFGLPLPYPEQAVTTVLAHSNDRRMFTGDNYNSCNVLDVIHPLWLARQQTSYGEQEPIDLVPIVWFCFLGRRSLGRIGGLNGHLPRGRETGIGRRLAGTARG